MNFISTASPLVLLFLGAWTTSSVKADRNDDLPFTIATNSTVGKRCAEFPIPPNTTPRFMPFVGNCSPDNNEVCAISYMQIIPKPRPASKVWACQCGYRNESNEQRLLKLVPNNKNICLGIEGFPCKTLPLEPDKHNQSCLSGYCDMDLNQCSSEHDHFHEDERRGNLGTVLYRFSIGLSLMSLGVSVINLL